jgi:hypothetical protein
MGARRGASRGTVMPQTKIDVSTASILVRGSVEEVRESVVRHGRQAWIAPVGAGWVLVLPDLPGAAQDPADPYDLVSLGRRLLSPGCRQVLVFCVGDGLGVVQLMSRDHDLAVIGWQGETAGQAASARAEPSALTFASRFGVPERGELLELLIEDLTGSPEDRLAAVCLALGLPVVAVGATSGHVSEERLHLPAVERHTRRGRVERWLGEGFSPLPWVRRTWVLRLSRMLMMLTAIPVLLHGWLAQGSVAQLLLGIGAGLVLVGCVAEVLGELRRSVSGRRVLSRGTRGR